MQRNVTPLRPASDAAWPYATMTANMQTAMLQSTQRYQQPRPPYIAPGFSPQPSTSRAMTPPPAGTPWTPRSTPTPQPPEAALRSQGLSFEDAGVQLPQARLPSATAQTIGPDTGSGGYVMPRTPGANMRSVTPPPSVGSSSLSTGEESGWVTVSTVNMSPFMILRIKALIELAAIQSYSNNSPIETTVTQVRPGRSCLRRNQSPEHLQRDIEAMRGDFDQRVIVLLNSLLSETQQVRRQDFRDILRETNEQFRREQIELLQRQVQHEFSNTGPQSTGPKLSFSPGASLICYDTNEKPRKIRDNHYKHFSKFLQMQAAQQQAEQAMQMQQQLSPAGSASAPVSPSSMPAQLPGVIQTPKNIQSQMLPPAAPPTVSTLSPMAAISPPTQRASIQVSDRNLQGYRKSASMPEVASLAAQQRSVNNYLETSQSIRESPSPMGAAPRSVTPVEWPGARRLSALPSTARSPA